MYSITTQQYKIYWQQLSVVNLIYLGLETAYPPSQKLAPLPSLEL